MTNLDSAGAMSLRCRMYCLIGTSAVIMTPCTAETIGAGGGREARCADGRVFGARDFRHHRATCARERLKNC